MAMTDDTDDILIWGTSLCMSYYAQNDRLRIVAFPYMLQSLTSHWQGYLLR